MQSKFSKKLAMIIVTILTISTLSAATIPFASATITSRPTVYAPDGTTSAPVNITAGTTALIDTTGMDISGAQIWLWLSTSGGSEINTALGDRPYAGPFLLSELIDTVDTHTYTFTPAMIGGLCNLLSCDSPFAGEQRSYIYLIGNGWINGTIPLKVQGEDVDYWIKIADVSPSDTIAGSEIGVSTNRVHFLPGFSAAPLSGAPETAVTVSGYALPTAEKYNVTEAGDIVLALLTPTSNDEGGWLWTGFSNAFNVEDLGAKVPSTSTPPQYTNVSISVIEDSTAAVLDTWNFTQYWREVYLESEGAALQFRGDGGNYAAVPDVTLHTGSVYDVEMEYFPAFGTASIYLGGVLCKTDVALNATGGVLTTITIPSLTTGTYTFSVIDNNDVNYNFTVFVRMVPYIYCTPDSGYVGDSFTVTGVNFLDYVGDYITVYFKNSISYPESTLLWNQTIASSTWNTGALTVPSSWGGKRLVEARIVDGSTPAIAAVNYTVLTMINVIPDEINSSVCETVEVEGTGFFYGTDDVEGWLVFIDNSQYFGYWDFFHYGISDTGDVMFEFATAGFRPGLHVVSVIPQSFGDLPWTITAKDCFVVTTVGDPIVAYLEGMNATVMALDGTIATLDTTIGELQVDLTAIGATVTSISGDVATIKTDVGTIKSSLSTLSASVSSVSGSMATLQTSIGTVQTSLASIDAVIGSMYGDLLTIDTTIGSFETSLDSIDATVSGLDSDVTALIGDVANIDTVLGSVAGTVTAMDGTLATIETDLGTVQVDLASAKTDIAAVETDVNDNLPVDMMPVWIAVILSLIAAIGSIAGVFIIQRKIA